MKLFLQKSLLILVLKLSFHLCFSSVSNHIVVLNAKDFETTNKLVILLFDNYFKANDKIEAKKFCVGLAKSAFLKNGWIATEFFRNMRKAYRSNMMKYSYIKMLLEHLKPFSYGNSNCYDIFRHLITTKPNVQMVYFKIFGNSNIKVNNNVIKQKKFPLENKTRNDQKGENNNETKRNNLFDNRSNNANDKKRKNNDLVE